MNKYNITEENIYLYCVEYYDEEMAQLDYKEHKKKYPEIVDFYDYLSNYDGYEYAYQFSDYFYSKQEAKKLAKLLSKKNKEFAFIRRYYTYINFENKIDWEFDEDYNPEQFSNGKEI
tara:strand:- start:744 stop:1094 length:351 start_codon:yes stop_codon:yes gene_type:complete